MGNKRKTMANKFVVLSRHMIIPIKVWWHCLLRFLKPGHRMMKWTKGPLLFGRFHIPFIKYHFCECGYKLPKEIKNYFVK